MCVRRVPRLPTPHRDVRDMRILQRVCIRDGRRMDALRGRVGATMEWHDDYDDDRGMTGAAAGATADWTATGAAAGAAADWTTTTGAAAGAVIFW